MCTILAIGQDKGLLHSRAELLRKCNCNAKVVTARPPEASEILKAHQFDLVVLCHNGEHDGTNRNRGVSSSAGRRPNGASSCQEHKDKFEL